MSRRSLLATLFLPALVAAQALPPSPAPPVAVPLATPVQHPAALPLSFDAEPVHVDLKGTWRARGTFLHNLFFGQANSGDLPQSLSAIAPGRLRGLEQTGFIEHGLRLSPSIAYRQIGALKIDLDLLDGVIWGDNDGLAKVPFFGGNPSTSDRFGNSVAGVALERAWLELNIPIGQLRVGRMPSQWGMGLLANSGDGLGADFGEYRYGSTVDRILFATRPVQIAETLLGDPNPKSDLVVAIGYDAIVDDARDADAPDPEVVCPTCPPQILYARPGDDVQQLVGVVLYKNERAQVWTEHDLVTAGAYVVYRSQQGSRSEIVVLDGYTKLRLGHIGGEGEVIVIRGTTEAVSGGKKSVKIAGGVGRLGYYEPGWGLDVELEVGHAPGDDEPVDKDFTGYPLHPDYNVGLILYEEVLAARTARAFGRDGRGLWSRGGVYNSTYVMPKVRWRPLDGMTVVLAYLWARAQEDTGAVWAGNAAPEAGELDLGHELDLAIRYDFFSKFHAKLETGVLFPGPALWRDVDPAIPDNRITNADRGAMAFTLQGRLGFEW